MQSQREFAEWLDLPITVIQLWEIGMKPSRCARSLLRAKGVA